MNNRRATGTNSLPFGASTSRDSKKRPLSPIAPSVTVKRPKASGPFVIDSDSESDDDGDDDDDDDDADRDDDDEEEEEEEEDDEEDDRFVSVRPRLPKRDLPRVREAEKPDEEEVIVSSRPNVQRDQARATGAPLHGRKLDKNRLKAVLAKRKLGTVAQGQAQQNARRAMNGLEVVLKSRPSNIASTIEAQKQRPVMAEADFSLEAMKINKTKPSFANKGTTQPSFRLPSSNVTSLSLQEIRTNQVTKDKVIGLAPRTAGRPLNEANKPSQVSAQSHPFLQNTNVRPSGREIPHSRSGNTPATREANTQRSQHAVNNGSSRNILDTTKAEHRGAAKEQGRIGGEWQKAKAKRPSTKQVKSLQRPEVGARYGHTLTTRKIDEVERLPPNSQQTSTATMSAQSHPSLAPPVQFSPSPPTVQTQTPARKMGQVSKGLPIDQTLYVPASMEQPQSIDSKTLRVSANIANTEIPAQEHALTATAVRYERTLASPSAKAPDTSDAMDSGSGVSASSLFAASEPTPAPDIRTKIPVAVMVPPSRRSSPSSNPASGMDDSGHGTSDEMDVCVEGLSPIIPEAAGQGSSAAASATMTSKQQSEEPPKDCTREREHSADSVAASQSNTTHSSPSIPAPKPTTAGIDIQPLPKPQPTLPPPEATTKTPPRHSPRPTEPEAPAQPPILPDEITLPPPSTPPTAEPYFEYTISQALSSATQPPSTADVTEITTHPFTSLAAANTQTERLFACASTQCERLDMQCIQTGSKLDEYGMVAHEAVFEGLEDPTKTMKLRLWVQRSVVGQHANHHPTSTPHPSLISKTVFIVRLWRLIDLSPPSSPSSSSSSSIDTNPTPTPLRTFHPVPTSSLYTTLPSANLAAKRLQIQLTHDPALQKMQLQWQAQNLKNLNAYIHTLEKEREAAAAAAKKYEGEDYEEEGDGDGEKATQTHQTNTTAHDRAGYWTSIFNGRGLGGEKFEIQVEKARLSGPRNL